MVLNGPRILNVPTIGASKTPTTKRTTARRPREPRKNNPDRIKNRAKSTEKTKPEKRLNREASPVV